LFNFRKYFCGGISAVLKTQNRDVDFCCEWHYTVVCNFILMRRGGIQLENEAKRTTKKRSKLGQIFKIFGIVLAAIILLPIITVFIIRGVNNIRFQLPDGVQEKLYVELGGTSQFINIRGADKENPVVIWLHGGPGSPDTFLTTTWGLDLENDYTFIRWDQRGSGRTYFQSEDAPLSFDILLSDLDDLVDYASERFKQPIVIAGHSWGTALGITYADTHPDKIAGYVGVGQLVNAGESDRLAALAAARLARDTGNEQDAAEIETLYDAFAETGITDENLDISGFLKFRNLTTSYLAPGGKVPFLTALCSPDFGWDDLRWNLLLMTDLDRFVALQRPLFAAFDTFIPPEQLEVKCAFIHGDNDYVCSFSLFKEYQQKLSAPSSEIFIMPGLGHTPMYDAPDEFGEILKEALRNMR
jgi:pimeloyl-ACP methyl ester carboxylesterase